MLNWRLCVRSLVGDVERPLPSPEQRGESRWVLWGTWGLPWQGGLEVSSSWKSRGLCLHPEACMECECPMAGGDRKLCLGRHSRLMAVPGEALRHGRGRSPFHGGRGLCLLAWPADGGFGRSWDPFCAQAPLPRPEEVLVLFSWVLTLWGRGFSCLYNFCQQEIWLLPPQAPLQELRRAL